MKLTLINPNIITQKGDFFGSGIPFFPITLAYTASYLRENHHQVQVIDAFGENPKKITETKEQFIQGLDTEEIINKIEKDTKVIIIYASLVITHNANLQLITQIRKQFTIPIIVLENIHSVVGYSLVKVKEDFFNVGADFLVLGDPEHKCLEIIKSIQTKQQIKPKIKQQLNQQSKIDGIIFQHNHKIITKPIKTYPKNLDILPFPAWDLFPIKNYWDLAYSHAPMTNNYLPLLTSRGCPNNCEFCITPFLLGKTWRPRSPKNVVDEIQYYINKFNVKEFHIEDFNPTVNKERIIEICQEIINRNMNINIKIAAGTKAETLDENTLTWMKKAGFSYVSISPETGSEELLKKMNKKFDHQHGINIVKHMYNIGITSQACFVIGFPGETTHDLNLTKKYIKELVKAGIDEIAIFIMIPIPGSNASAYSPLGYKNLSQLTFSPKWINTYKELNHYRTKIYASFLLWKLRYHPKKIAQHFKNILTKNFNTKIEMALWRVTRMNLKGKIGKTL